MNKLRLHLESLMEYYDSDDIEKAIELLDDDEMEYRFTLNAYKKDITDLKAYVDELREELTALKKECQGWVDKFRTGEWVLIGKEEYREFLRWKAKQMPFDTAGDCEHKTEPEVTHE